MPNLEKFANSAGSNGADELVSGYVSADADQRRHLSNAAASADCITSREGCPLGVKLSVGKGFCELPKDSNLPIVDKRKEIQDFDVEE